ncbi:MAG: putative pimeloyl-ACP methyl ester carboxylesterase [Actinobacteria bacterium]|jgi:pimeloyl-ACP methyl ester carboxylesterase|nr:putative pimeloyl-ACP methyl ester carboxylesterase [Actinomycetota bacterium]
MKLTTFVTEVDPTSPPLVLIHGLGSAATTFKPILAELSKKFRVISVDLPGHGQSPYSKSQAMDPASLGAAIFETVKSEHGIEKFHVVGNSLGGWIALEMAASRPEQILTVTGLAPAGLWLVPATGRLPSEARSYYLAKSLKPFIKIGLKSKLLRKIGFARVSPKWQELSYETCFDASIAVVNCRSYFPTWDGMIGRRFDAKIPESVHVTILFGDSDNTLPAEHSQERSLSPSHSMWLTIENCGHAPMWDHPDLVLKAVLETTSR